MEMISRNISRAPELFGVPHPSRDHPDIQSIVYSKAEYRECLSGPNPFEDIRINDVYFNSQVLFQRLLTVYGSMMLLFEQSAGKTGCIECYRDYIEKEAADTISTFYYVAAKLQGKEFEEQIVATFGTDEDKEKLAAGKIVRATVLRQVIKRKNIEIMTYGEMAKKIEEYESKEDLIHMFCNAFVVIDEFHEVKLTETKDKGKTRKRREIYKQYWRLFKVVPTCVVVLATGTYITDDISEFIYSINLMPNTKQIYTPLALSIAQSVCDDERYGITLDSLGLGDGENGYNWVYDFDMIGLEGNDAVSAEQLEQFRAEREEKLEPIIRGRVMYARAPATKAIIAYMDDDETERLSRIYNTDEFSQESGEVITNWRTVQHDVDIDKTVTRVDMSMFQTLGYLDSVRRFPEGLYIQATQSCVFVFPPKVYAKACVALGISAADEKYLSGLDFSSSHGGDGYDMCFQQIDVVVKSKIPKTVGYLKRTEEEKIISVVEPRDWFLDYLRQDDCLYNSGSIIWDVVWLSTRKNGFPVYVPSKNLHSCLHVILEALKLRDFVHYTGEETVNADGLPDRKENRVALISKDYEKTIHNILRVYGHPANARGEYIKTILVSPIGTTGLNIPNIGNICVTEPQHNSAETRQAVARGMRPNSHFASLKLVKGKPWNWETFPVYFHYYMPKLYGNDIEDEAFNELKSIAGLSKRHLIKMIPVSISHWRIYANAHTKEIEEAGLAHSVKRIAIDYQINMGRNIRPDIEDYSFKADYLPAHYDAYNCDPTWDIDLSTYESYYLSSKQLWNSYDLLNELTNRPYVTTDYIVSLADDWSMIYSRQEVLYSLRKLVETQKVIGNDYLGFPLVLQEDKGIFYPTTDYIHTPSASLINYSQVKTFKQTFTIDTQIVEWLNDEGPNNDLDYYKTLVTESDTYRTVLTTIPNPYKCAMLEEALIHVLVDGNEPEEWETKVIEAYNVLAMAVPSSTSDDDYIVIHQVDILFSGAGSNYVAVDNVIKAKKKLRMYVYSQSTLQFDMWRACTDIENIFYSTYLNNNLETHLQAYYAKFSYLGFIGVIVRSDKVHIRQFEEVKKPIARGKKIKATNLNIYKSKGKGQDSESIQLKDMLHMLYMATPEAHLVSVSASERKILLQYFFKTKVGAKHLDSKMLAKFPSAKLHFFNSKLREQNAYADDARLFSKTNPKRSLPDQLRIKLMELEAIFAIVGDIDNVVINLSSEKQGITYKRY